MASLARLDLLRCEDLCSSPWDRAGGGKFGFGANGVGKIRLGRPMAALPGTQSPLPVCITQVSLTGIGLLSLFLQKLGKAHNHQRSASLKLLEEAFCELGWIVPVLLLDKC